MNIQYTLSDDLIDEITVDSLIKHYKINAENIKEMDSTMPSGDMKDAIKLASDLTSVIEYFTTAHMRKEKGVDF
jgi:hypothetical protein